MKKIKTTPVVQGDGEKFRYFPISTKHPCYAAGRQAYCLGLSINQCPARTRDGFDDGRFHWLAGWIQARVADRLWKLLPPGWDAVNRMSGKIDCGSDS